MSIDPIQHQLFMRKALKEAKFGVEQGEGVGGAVVVVRQQVIAKGYDQVRRLTDATAHAPMIALTAAMEYLQTSNLKSGILYTTVEPCVMCAGALFWSRIGSLVYGAPAPEYGFSKYAPAMLSDEQEVKGGVLKDKCQALVEKESKKE